MQQKIVFLHTPKCAGAALKDAIISACGQDSIFFDYDDNPANPLSDHCIDPVGSLRRFAERADALRGKCIAYGHFHPAKYRAVWPDARWMTVLRHPVDRLISHYFFWRESRSFGSHPVREYALRYNLSLLDFARLPFSQHYYRGIFFAGLERHEFDFVGRANDLDKVAHVFGSALQSLIHIRSINVGSLRLDESALDEIEASRPELMNILSGELEFYERWTSIDKQN